MKDIYENPWRMVRCGLSGLRLAAVKPGFWLRKAMLAMQQRIW